MGRSNNKEEPPILRDARKLCYHTLRVTQNLNNFPRKYRYSLVDRLITSSFDIRNNLKDANESRGEKRIAYQTQALRHCDKMKFYLQCTYEVLKPECSIPYWDEMISDIEEQAKKWRAATWKQIHNK